MVDEERSDPKRGRQALWPSQIPLKGWKDICLRTWESVFLDRVPFMSAGIAFFFLIGLVPVLVATISIYGLVAEPSDVEGQVSRLQGLLPDSAMDLIVGELRRITTEPRTASLGLVLSLLVALWGGSRATDSLIIGLNVAYGEQGHRNIFHRKMLSILLTLATVLFAALVVGTMVALPVVGRLMGPESETFIAFLRWGLLCSSVFVWLMLLYRFAPERRPARWSWLTVGAVFATFVWVAASMGLSYYTARITSFSSSFGSLSAVILLLFWLYVFGLAVLLGAKLNAEIERQTREDSTVPPARPLGRRGAFAADTVGEARGKR